MTEGVTTYPTIAETITAVKRSTGRRFFIAIRGEIISEPPAEGSDKYRCYELGGIIRVRRPDLLRQLEDWQSFADRKGQELRIKMTTYDNCLFVG